MARPSLILLRLWRVVERTDLHGKSDKVSESGLTACLEPMTRQEQADVEWHWQVRRMLTYDPINEHSPKDMQGRLQPL